MQRFKIDIHTHILPPELPNLKSKLGYGGFIEYRPCKNCSDVDLYMDNGLFFRRVKQNCFSPEVRLSECDQSGVHVQVLSTVPTFFSYWTKGQDGLYISQILNDHLASVISKNPSRFLGLGTLPLQDPELASKEAERCVKDLGLIGFQIGSHVNEFNLSDPMFFPVYETCERLGAALFVHPWDMMGQERMNKYWLPWLVGMPAEGSLAICSMIFGGVFSRFPKLRVAFAHGGGSFAFTLGRIQHGFESRPDLCAVDCALSPEKFLGHFWVDSLVHSVDSLQFILKTFGAHRVCLGSDYPFPLGEALPGSVVGKMGLPNETLDWINYRSAFSWLGLQEEKWIYN